MKKQGRFLIGLIIIVLICVGAVLAGSIVKDSLDIVIQKPKVTSAPNDKVSNDNQKFWYSKLKTNEKKAYDNIYAEITSFPKRISIPKINVDELKRVYVALSYDNPELFFLSKCSSVESVGIKNYFVPQYIMKKQEYQSSLSKIKDIISRVKSATSSMSEYEKELYIHDFIIDNCQYYDGNSEIKFTACGVLVNGLANCEGYSRSMQLLLNECGVYCRVVVGDATNEEGKTQGHMWNVVNINNRDYNLDVTWDDYILLNEKNKNIDPSHAYFNIPTIELSSSHKIDSQEYSKDCIYTEDNFFNVTGLLIENYDNNSKKQITNNIASELSNGRKSIELKFSNKTVYNTAIDRFFKRKEIYRLILRANMKTSNPVSDTYITYVDSDKNRIIRIFFS